MLIISCLQLIICYHFITLANYQQINYFLEAGHEAIVVSCG